MPWPRSRRSCWACRPGARRSRSTRPSVRGASRRLVARADLQPRRVRRLDPARSEQLSRLHAGASCSITYRSIRGQHRIPEWRRAGSATPSAAATKRRSRRRRHRLHDPRHRRERPYRLQRAGRWLCAHTHVAHLERRAREANARGSAVTGRACRERALSMGMATILHARDIVLIATGAEKAGVVQGMIEGLITTQLPASLLQVHRDVDGDARSRAAARARRLDELRPSARAAAARCPRRWLRESIVATSSRRARAFV